MKTARARSIVIGSSAAIAAIATASAPIGATSASAAAERPRFQVPFTCGEKWSGYTRSNHSPNPNSIDFLRWSARKNVSKGRPILASFGGKVTFAGWDAASGTPSRPKNKGAGWYVKVGHGSSGWGTSYMHLIERPKVKTGDKVTIGQQLGRVGATGHTGGVPHLHYQQWKGKPSNTLAAWFDGSPANITVSRHRELTSKNAWAGYATSGSTKGAWASCTGGALQVRVIVYCSGGENARTVYGSWTRTTSYAWCPPSARNALGYGYQLSR